MTFVTVRRGNWIIKVSVFKSKYVLVVAQHYIDLDNVMIRHFDDQEKAADFLELIAQEDDKNYERKSIQADKR